MTYTADELKDVDIAGNLETIEHLAQVGQLLVKQNLKQHIPTILEDIQEHIQRLVLDYAAVEEKQ